jgi:tripeptide aminopeptidase
LRKIGCGQTGIFRLENRAMNRQRLLDRFLRYVRIDTTAREGAGSYPSSPGQIELGRLLVEELRALGIAARQDRHGVVLATIPPTSDRPAEVIAYCAHLDDNPELARLLGQTLITSDGTTLLGADDKAGVAVIMETTAYLTEHPEIEHGPLRLCFTCDEEVGRGVDKLNLDEIAAAACYTLDGQGADTIDVETFSADLGVVTIRGVNIHPSIAKGRMTNALRAAADFLGRLPRDRLAPETTEGREGFLHPYEIGGGVAEVKLRIILRDFDTAKLEEHAALLRQAAAATMAEFPQAQIDVALKPQYRNMAEGLARDPRVVAYAQAALERLGRRAELTIVRGGTDGSRLTELGLPTPNLATGQHNPHSPLEWACLEEMLAAAEWLVSLAEVWAKKGSDRR